MKEKIKKYEELLNKRDEVEKYSFHMERLYMKKFGNLLVKEYELQIETIKYKKMIAYCTKKVNYNQEINEKELDEYIENILCSYKIDLDSLIETNKFYHQKSEKVEEYNASRIKNIYYMIVHMIHPDLHPELQSFDEIKELWNKAVEAYKCNNLDLLVQIYDKLTLLIKKDDDLVIENIDAKIKAVKDEIEYITSNEPYTFASLLKDKKKSKEFKDKLQASIETYKKYLEELKLKMKEFNIKHYTEA